MARGFTGLVVLALVATALWATTASGQSSSCSSVLVSLSPCLNYITGNSSTPSSGCCSQLATAVRSQPACLCEVLNGGGSSAGISINQTQALALPGACNVQTPSLSRCNGAASPAGSPSETPASDTPSGTGSKTVPTTTDDSDGISTKMSMSLLFFAFLAVAYASA